MTENNINLIASPPNGIPLGESLHSLHPQILENQATQNLGTLGHASHGKSTLVEAISGIKPLKLSTELLRNITIRLGYANFKIYKCDNCPAPDCYVAQRSHFHGPLQCALCQKEMTLCRHFSFVDCPGHDCLMATMLNGAAVMDAALLVVAANQPVPQPQTAEHLAAAEIMNLKNMVCIQTKVDLVTEQQMYSNYEGIKEFLHGTPMDQSPVIPLSCTPRQKYNVDVLLQYLVEQIPVPSRNYDAPLLMPIVRSFDVNHPGCEVSQLSGGVAGGSLLRGVLKVGDLVEIRPGLIIKSPKGRLTHSPLRTYVKSLFSERNSMQFAVAGGLIGVGTLLDPILTKSDKLVGQVLGIPGNMPPVFLEMEFLFLLLRRLLGVKVDDNSSDSTTPMKVTKIVPGETLVLSIGSTSIKAKVVAVKRQRAKVKLHRLCCAAIGDKVSISREYNSSSRLIGCGEITQVLPLEPASSRWTV